MSVHNIRNIALAGQASSGKTSIIEQCLLHTGVIGQLGEVTRGTTVCDYDSASKQRQHSLNPTPVYCDYQQHRLNLIDSPGMPDFIGRTISILPAVETVALVIDAQESLGMLSKQLSDIAKDRKKCQMIIINKIDAGTEKLSTLLQQLTDEIGTEALPINLPSKDGSDVIDCYFDPDFTQQTALLSVEQVHSDLIDQVVEVDEALMEVYLEQGQALNPTQLHEPFELALRSGHLIPICFVSARTGTGIPDLLRVMTELMPTPLEGNPPLFLNHGKAFDLTPQEQGHVIAHVFKVEVDPFMGRLAFLRIHQGTITVDSQLFIGEGKKAFKVNHLFRVQGKERVAIRDATAGDICAIAKVEDLEFDSVLHDSHDEDFLTLKSLKLPAPMFSVAISPTRRGDEQKLSDTLKKILAEDPSLAVQHRASLNETVLTGVGELHIQVALERMEEQFKCPVASAEPAIDYRETITQAAEASYRHKKQSGGAGQFGEVSLRIRPLSRGDGFRFINHIVGGVIPGNFIPAVEKGVRQVLSEGAIAGFPMQDVEVELFDGKHHPVDSKEIAFVSAGKRAFLAAIESAKAIVLEPIVDVSITLPTESMGDVSGDMASHRGLIVDTRMDNNQQTVLQAKVPLSEMASYGQRLKSLTSGRGRFTLSLSHFEPVPPATQQSLCKQFRSELHA